MTLRKLRVFLIIEAGEVALSSRKLLAESAGYNVLSAVSGAQAFQLIEDHSVDLVILDTAVRDMPLAKLVEQLHRKMPDVPIYLMNAQPWVPDAVKGKVDGVFEKMRDPQIMITELERLFPER